MSLCQNHLLKHLQTTPSLAPSVQRGEAQILVPTVVRQLLQRTLGMKIGPYTNLNSYIEYKFGLGTQNCASEAPNDIIMMIMIVPVTVILDSPLFKSRFYHRAFSGMSPLVV